MRFRLHTSFILGILVWFLYEFSGQTDFSILTLPIIASVTKSSNQSTFSGITSNYVPYCKQVTKNCQLILNLLSGIFGTSRAVL